MNARAILIGILFALAIFVLVPLSMGPEPEGDPSHDYP